MTSPKSKKASANTRRHVGDFMTPQTRSAVMSRIRGKNTKPELLMVEAFGVLGLSPERHVRDLPGCPDFVFREQMVAVFVDGDFWHGRKFNEWRDKLSEKWEAKIAATRMRDRKARRLLRATGWKVMAFWEFDVKRNANACANRVKRVVAI